MESLLPGLTSAPNLHPMVVHFPIALWLAATAAWGFALLRRNDDAWRFGLWMHTLGAGGAIAAVVLGYLATAKMGHDAPGHELVHVHRDIMVGATGLSVILTGLAWWRRAGPGIWRPILGLASVALAATMTLGSDRGAELVFRYGIGVSHETPPQTGHVHDHGTPGQPDSQHEH